MKKKLTFSICMPIYKGSHVLFQALDSVLKQKGVEFEVIIGDDNPAHLETEIKRNQEIITGFNDHRIKYYKNKSNVGYATNMKQIVSRAKNDVVFLMAQDDILAKDALLKTHDAFFLDKDIGVVTRPYFWFKNHISVPVRVVLPLNENKDTVFSLSGNNKKREHTIQKVIESVGQLSGLAMYRTFIKKPLHSTHAYTTHVYPFLDIITKHKGVFLKDYIVAVRIEDSQTRHVSKIYDISPTFQWVSLFKDVFKENKFRIEREAGINLMATHFVGLVQVKNYAHLSRLLPEIKELIIQRKKNLIEPIFWFYSILTIVTPRFLLRKMADWYKQYINSKKVPSIPFVHP